MKPGDLVKVIFNDHALFGSIGLIVELDMLINDHPMWIVMIEGELFIIRARHLEVIDEAG